jgi:hypothetical protein
MRTLAFATAVLALSLSSLSAAAAEGDAPNPAVHTLTVNGAFSNAWVHGTSLLQPYHNDAFFQLGAWYRLSPRVALGGLASFAPGVESEHQFWRLSSEARFFALATRFVEVWGAGEAGVAMTRYVANDVGNGDCIAPGGCGIPSNERRPHFAPLVGLGAGVDFLPLRYVSIGLEGRALLPYFAAQSVENGPEGASPVFTVGLSLSGRVSIL